MKIAHMSDLHLGYSSSKNRNSTVDVNEREQDGYNAFNEAIDQIIKEKVDHVIIAGDVFHTPKPRIYTIIQAQNGLRKLAKNKIKVHVVSGNHDSTDIRNEPPATEVLNEPTSGIYSYSEPLTVVKLSEDVYAHIMAHHLYSDQADSMKKLKPMKDKVNFLIAHGSVFDVEIGGVINSEQSPREVIIPEKILDNNWSYALLGHIHQRGFVGSKDGGKTDTSGKRVFYNGSLIRRGFADPKGYNGRGWTMWTISPKKEVSYKMFNIWERPQFDLPVINTMNKTVTQIEKMIEKQLVDVLAKSKNEDGTTDPHKIPIVRQTLDNITPGINLSIHWAKFTEYIDKCFSHTFKKNERLLENNNLLKTNEEGEVANTEKPLLQQFEEWVEGRTDEELAHIEKEDVEAVIDKTKNWLKQGQDKVLSTV